MTANAGPSIHDRYARAVRLTAPKIAAEAPAATLYGYWLNEHRYFFVAERWEPSIGRLVAVPSLADANTGRVTELVSPEDLATLLSQSGRAVDLRALSCAEFDMPSHDVLAVKLGAAIYVVDWQQLRLIDEIASSSAPALYSPDGSFACFVKGHDLWLRGLASGAERPLTTEGSVGRRLGQQPETNAAALSYRRRPVPMGLWSHDSQWFLTHVIDERAVPELALVQNVPAGGRPSLHSFKYAMPGDPLPVATYLAIHIESGRVTRFDDFPMPVLAWSPFTYRMAWFTGTDTAWVVRLDRYRRHAELIRLDLARGTGCVVLSETTDTGYLDLHPIIGMTPNIHTLPETDEVIWFSERDGWGHLYLYDISTGTLKSQITHGDWLVRDIVHVYEKERRGLFLANGVEPDADRAHKTLCTVNFDGSGFEVLLRHDGDLFVPRTESWGADQDRRLRCADARAGISPDGRFGIVRYASVERGNRIEIVDLGTRQGTTIASALPGSQEMQPRRFTALAADGVTRLHGVMFLPSDFDETRRYPLVDYLYPGPQIAHQPQSFHSVMAAPAQALAELGFITVVFNTRGMPIGSRTFHQGGYPNLLEPQLSDHEAVVRQLCARHSFIDRERVGLFGQSGGGAAAARALFDHGETFKVGVAVCGNHRPDFYTANWSDRYRGPDRDERWARQDNTTVAHKLKGKLLLISGDMDENVHVSHTLALADALIQANKNFDLLIVPNEGHSLMMTNGYVYRRIWDYFVAHLLGETPPGVEIRFAPHELAHFSRALLREREQ